MHSSISHTDLSVANLPDLAQGHQHDTQSFFALRSPRRSLDTQRIRSRLFGAADVRDRQTEKQMSDSVIA